MARLSHILSTKRLAVVTGKGGAGKSYLALALAHRLSMEGKRVWLVEIGRRRDKAFCRLPELLGITHLSHAPTEVLLGDANFHASILDPTESLAEYVDLKLPTGGLAGLLLNNKVTASLLEVVPGLPDLVILGKIWHALTNPKAKWQPDIVILDAPATGHAASLLRAPKNFRDLTKVGPVHKDASSMVEFFSDSANTALLLATLPEEMSLQETAEFSRVMKEDFPSPHVVLNKVFPPIERHGTTGKGPVWQAYAYARSRYEREQESIHSFPDLARTSIPFFFPEPGKGPLHERIAEVL